jgi:hypothetical protein
VERRPRDGGNVNCHRLPSTVAICKDEAGFPRMKPECLSMPADPIAKILINDPSSTEIRTGSGVCEPVIHDPQHMASRLSPQMAPQFDLSPE